MKANRTSLASCSRIKTAPLRLRSGNPARCFHSSTRRSTPRDYYQDLEVSPDATKVEIKAKFYELSKKYHPDVAKDDKSRDKFVLVNQAYGELMNDAKRSELDRRLRARHPHSQPEPSFVRTRSTSFSNRWRTTPPPSQGPRYPYTPPYARAQQAYEQRQRQQQHDGTHTGHGHDPHPGQGQQHRPHDHVFETHRMHKYQYYRPPPGQTATPGSYTWSAHDPFSSPWVQRATGKRAAGTESGSGSGSHGGASGGTSSGGDVPPGPGSGRPYGHNPYASDPPGGGATGASSGRTSGRAQRQSAHDAVARASPFGRMVVALGAATLIMGLAQWGSHG